MASSSDVLDTFVGAVAGSDPDRAGPLQRELEATVADADERELAIRCLTAAAQAWRDSIESEHQATRIDTGEQAFKEWEFAEPIAVDVSREKINDKLLAALSRASGTLGPTRGGELGSIKAPSGLPRVVEEVRPSQDDLMHIALRAGEAVGLTAAQGSVDSVAVLRGITGPN